MRIIISWLSEEVRGRIFTYSRPHLFIDLTVSHFFFLPIHVVFMNYIPQTGSVLIQGNEYLYLLVLPIPFLLSLRFLWPPCGSSTSTSTSPLTIVVRSPLLRNIFNEQHWKLVNIAFMAISYPESSGSLASGWPPGETLGYCNFNYRMISAVKQWKPWRSLYRAANQKNLNFFEFSRVSPGAYPPTKKPEDSGYEIAFMAAKLENLFRKQNFYPGSKDVFDLRQTHVSRAAKLGNICLRKNVSWFRKALRTKILWSRVLWRHNYAQKKLSDGPIMIHCDSELDMSMSRKRLLLFFVCSFCRVVSKPLLNGTRFRFIKKLLVSLLSHVVVKY